MTDMQTKLVKYAKAYAADDNWVYYQKSKGETNLDKYHVDCATLMARIYYDAKGWADFPSSKHGSYGYFEPHISHSDYDTFLTVNGWQKKSFDSKYLYAGSIIITDETLGHTLMYIGGNQIIDANNYYGYGADSVAIRSYPCYNTSCFAYIYVPEDVELSGISTTEGGLDVSKIPTVQYGDSSNVVKNLQSLMNLWMSKSVKLVVDGYYGTATKARVKEYQTARNKQGASLVVDGICGAQTWADILCE